MNKILIDGDLALRVRNELRALVDLAGMVESPRYSDTVGLPDAILAILIPILIPVRELDMALPDYDNDRVMEPTSLRSLQRRGRR